MSMEWLQKARAGGAVQRAHTIPTIQKHYSNAEHTFNSVVILKELIRHVEETVISAGLEPIREVVAVNYMIKHDLAEVYTGDMPAPVKKDPIIKAAMAILESRWEQQYAPSDYLYELNATEYMVTSMADSMEFLMFCVDEYKLGNRHPDFMFAMENGFRFLTDKNIDSDGLLEGSAVCALISEVGSILASRSTD